MESVKFITNGKERMPQALLTRLKDIFPGVKFLQIFCTSGRVIATTKCESLSSTCFKINETPQEFKIVNSELCLRSNSQIKGYISSNDSFTDDGWFIRQILSREKASF